MYQNLYCDNLIELDNNELLCLNGGGLFSEVLGAVVSGIAGVCADKFVAKVVTTVVSSAVGGPVGVVAGLATAAVVLYIWNNY
jgi:hypothetical protein